MSPVRFLGLIFFAITLIGCGDEGEHQGATTVASPSAPQEEYSRYLADVQEVLKQSYRNFEWIQRVFDDEQYMEGLERNADNFAEGAQALTDIDPPLEFEDEHDSYVEALRLAADGMRADLGDLGNGADLVDILVDEDSASTKGFAAIGDACTELERQADQLKIYDAFSCGGVPYYITAVEPPWAERVFVNTCCGGSDPNSGPYEVFYGSDARFEDTLAHYKEQMEERGFAMREPEWAAAVYGSQTYQFEKEGVPTCFWIQEFTPEYRLDFVDEEDVKPLEEFPHAYAATFLRLCGA